MFVDDPLRPEVKSSPEWFSRWLSRRYIRRFNFLIKLLRVFIFSSMVSSSYRKLVAAESSELWWMNLCRFLSHSVIVSIAYFRTKIVFFLTFINFCQQVLSHQPLCRDGFRLHVDCIPLWVYFSLENKLLGKCHKNQQPRQSSPKGTGARPWDVFFSYVYLVLCIYRRQL